MKKEQKLNADERKLASKLQVYLVWYEDRFSGDPAFVIGVYLKKTEAEAHAGKRPLDKTENGNWDGYEFDGPHNLLKAYETGLLSGGNKTAEEWVHAALTLLPEKNDAPKGGAIASAIKRITHSEK